MKGSVVNSAGGSFCWNYGIDTFYCNYAGDNAPCIYAVMLVDFSVAIMQVTVSVAIVQLEVAAALMQVTVSAANMWMAVCIVIMHMGVSVAIMQVVFFAVDYAHNSFHCNYAGASFFITMQVTVLSDNFISLSLTAFFIKLTRQYLRAFCQACSSPLL